MVREPAADLCQPRRAARVGQVGREDEQVTGIVPGVHGAEAGADQGVVEDLCRGTAAVDEPRLLPPVQQGGEVQAVTDAGGLHGDRGHPERVREAEQPTLALVAPVAALLKGEDVGAEGGQDLGLLAEPVLRAVGAEAAAEDVPGAGAQLPPVGHEDTPRSRLRRMPLDCSRARVAAWMRAFSSGWT